MKAPDTGTAIAKLPTGMASLDEITSQASPGTHAGSFYRSEPGLRLLYRGMIHRSPDTSSHYLMPIERIRCIHV